MVSRLAMNPSHLLLSGFLVPRITGMPHHVWSVISYFRPTMLKKYNSKLCKILERQTYS